MRIGLIPILVLVLSVVVLAMSAYWFQVRPSNIRSGCANYGIKKGTTPDRQSGYYRLCLAQHGMKPESLFTNGTE